VVGVYSGPEFFHVYPNGDAIHIVTTLFDCRTIGGDARPDGRETVEVRFFPPDDLPPMAERCRARVADALAGRPQAVVR
jgi:hypothetical protein